MVVKSNSLTLCFILVLICSFICNYGIVTSCIISDAFEKSGLVPDIITKAPSTLANMTYGSTQAELGNELEVDQVSDEPIVTWEVDPEHYYTLVMIDPDSPTPDQARHWLLVNIPGSDPNQGVLLASYLSPAPPPATGKHRYALLIFEHPGEIVFEEEAPEVKDRVGFNIKKFVDKYALGDPLAGNFFYAKTL